MCNLRAIRIPLGLARNCITLSHVITKGVFPALQHCTFFLCYNSPTSATSLISSSPILCTPQTIISISNGYHCSSMQLWGIHHVRVGNISPHIKQFSTIITNAMKYGLLPPDGETYGYHESNYEVEFRRNYYQKWVKRTELVGLQHSAFLNNLK